MVEDGVTLEMNAFEAVLTAAVMYDAVNAAHAFLNIRERLRQAAFWIFIV